MRPILTPEESALLADREAFERLSNERGWHLLDRSLRSMELGNRTLLNGTWVDVDAQRIGFTGTTVRAQSFTNVVFEQCQLQEATFENVTFARCNFLDVRIRKVRFRNCHFRECSFEQVRFRDSQLEDCRFDQLRARTFYIDDASLVRSEFHNVDVGHLRATNVRLEQLSVHQGGLAGVVLGESNSQALTLREIELRGIDVDSGTHQQWTLDGAHGTGVLFSDAVCSQTILTRCKDLRDFRAVGTRFNDLAMEGCPLLLAPALRRCEITGLSVRGSQIAFLQLLECHLKGANQLRGSTIHGLALIESRVEQLTVDDVDLAQYLELNGATFVNSHVGVVRYGNPLRREENNVVYENSNPFPPSE